MARRASACPVALLSLVALSVGTFPARAATWLGTWGAAPLPPTPAAGPFPATASFHDVTVRQVLRLSAVNTWIRTSGAFDGVLDFDAALRDPADPQQIAAGLHAGDHLHGSDAGYQALARSIDLAVFR